MTDSITEIIQQLAVPRYAPRIKPTPIPTAAWNDEPLFCLELNDQWVSHLLGVMTALDQPDTWVGTPEEINAARQQVNEIMAAFMEQCDPMSNCCNDIPLQRIDENGHYQQSTDGGTTWTNTPSADPRNSIPRVPPYPPASTDNSRCAYADSIVQHFKTQFVALIEAGQTTTEILGLLTSAAELVFGPLTGPIGWIIPALIAIPTAIIAFGITDFEAAMTDTVWNKLRCLIFTNMSSDGTITDANLDGIYSGISGVSPDNIVQTVFRSWFVALGTTGMTNAAHLGMGETGADCVACICGGTWFAGLNAPDGSPVGRDTLVASGINGDGKFYITVNSLDRGDGAQQVSVTSVSADDKCFVSWAYPADYEISTKAYTPPGTFPKYDNFVYDALLTPRNATCVFILGNHTPFQATFTFEEPH